MIRRRGTAGSVTQEALLAWSFAMQDGSGPVPVAVKNLCNFRWPVHVLYDANKNPGGHAAPVLSSEGTRPMTETMEDEVRVASNAGVIETGSKRSDHREGFLIPEYQPCRCQSDSLNDGRNGNHDGEGGFGNPPDSDDADNIEIEAILREFTGTLIRLLEPRYAEVVWRAEILNHPPSRIATDLGLSEQIVTRRLQLGRRTLQNLVILTLQSTLAD